MRWSLAWLLAARALALAPPCRVDAPQGRADYDWYLDGRSTHSPYAPDAPPGLYRCRSSGPLGAVLSTAVRVVAPYIRTTYNTDDNETLTAYQGDPVALRCPVDSDPPPLVEWRRDGQPIESPLLQLPKGTLLLADAAPQHSAVYSCEARNPQSGRSVSGPAIRLVVVPASRPAPPSFLDVDTSRHYSLARPDTPDLRFVYALHGGDATLACAVRGRPRPKVTWDFRPPEPPDAPLNREFHSMDLLRLTALTEDHDGFYTCTAVHAHGSLERRFRLVVLRPPYLKLTPASEYVPAARTVRFNCSAGGNPPPEVTWYKDGQRIEITGRFKIQSGEKKPPGLIVSDTVSTDRGVYQCIASNPLGEVQAWGLLSLPPPDGVAPPRRVECAPLDSHTVRVIWEAADYETVAYTVHYYTDGGVEHSGLSNQSVVFDVDRLNPYERYTFYVRSYIKKPGLASDPSERVVCQGQGVPIFLYSFNNGSVLVSWREIWKVVPDVQQWRLQWRSHRSEIFLGDVAMAQNFSTYIVDDIAFVEKLEFRLLASTKHDWLAQNLSYVKWTSSKYIIPYDDFAYNNELRYLSLSSSHIYGRTDDADSNLEGYGNWTLINFPAPTDLQAYPTGPQTINVTWRCDDAENASLGFTYNVCYSKNIDAYSLYEESNDKYRELCIESTNTWLELSELEPNTEYQIRVQSVILSQKKGGPFSTIVSTYTRNNVVSSVVDVRWQFIDKGVLNVTWVPNAKFFLKNPDFASKATSNIIYTVYYNHNVQDNIEKWKSKNVTNSNGTQLTDIDMTLPCYMFVSLLGEGDGPLSIGHGQRPNVIVIPPGGKMSSKQESEDWPNGIEIFLYVAVVVIIIILGIAIYFCVKYVFWRRHKLSHIAQSNPASHSRRINRSQLECEELVGPITQIDPKRGVLYINGVCAEAKGGGPSEPLLNGHVHITENPHFSARSTVPNGGCKHSSYQLTTDGTLDMSRYDESTPESQEVLTDGNSNSKENHISNICKRVDSSKGEANGRTRWHHAPALGPNG